MKLNDCLHGFKVTRCESVDELSSELIEMSHIKTGARLVWLKNNEENKLFSIAFKTLPSDDTGVFHILEHSVLCGSDKYPVKEPFLELMKSSMNTFLNAMTFPDKTLYPVSSRNDRDFMNLTKVYLDAVFRPSIYSNPCIFQQEGWHTEYRSKDDVPLYKGVVFNEMKGVMSSVFDRIDYELLRMLFPDNCYHYNSGGDPVSIPDLTYEQFIETHKTYYHPSNSYIYLDGPVDIDAVLELIDSEYLSKYEMSDVKHDIPLQKQIAPTERTCYYEISAEEPETEHTHYVWGKVLADWSERVKILAYAVLAWVLTGTNDAPLKRALLDTGLCLDAEMTLMDGNQQSYGILAVQNTDRENCDKLAETIRSTVSKIVAEGIDRRDLEAAINRFEFKFREGDEPQALERNIYALSSWLYGGDPLMYIVGDKDFAELRSKLSGDYFEKLLEEWLLDENGRAVLYLLPSHSYGAEQKKDEDDRVRNRVNAMTDAQKDDLIRQNAALDKWQGTADTPEQLATLPRLPLSEVSPEPISYVTNEDQSLGVKLLRHPASKKGITSIALYFSIADLCEDELVLLESFTNAISNLPTKNYSGAELQRKITSILGSLAIGKRVFKDPQSSDLCSPYLVVQTRFLEQNLSQALELTAEILNNTIYDDCSLVHELLKQQDDQTKHSIIASGHSYAMQRARASLSAPAAMNELLGGYENYKRIHAMLDNAGDDMSGFINTYKSLAAKLFCRERLTASITSADTPSIDQLINKLPHGTAPESERVRFTLDLPAKQGVIIPSGVSYSGAALANKAKSLPVWNVLSTVLSLEYLWTEVRVKGGAYGAGASVNNNREGSFYSYRDPSPAASLETFAASGEFLSKYCAKNPSIDSYIISTIARQEPLTSDSSKGFTADSFYFNGTTEEQRRENRRKMLSLKADDLLSESDSLKELSGFCVFGPEEAVKACGDDLVIDHIA